MKDYRTMNDEQRAAYNEGLLDAIDVFCLRANNARTGDEFTEADRARRVLVALRDKQIRSAE